jgi:5-methylcytosine-specific restriction enzyme subunit McrC
MLAYAFNEYTQGEYINHPKLHASADRIAWDLDQSYNGVTSFLPVMKSDITLSYKGKTLIIDTKFYGRMTQQNFDKHTIHSGNLYQIFTYVKNKDKEMSGNVQGALLYAKTEERITPDLDAKFGANKIMVKTLDLNCDFSKIKSQLDELALSIYSV